LGTISKVILLAALCLFATRAHAVSVTNLASADASLIEVATNNNNGGQPWVLSGRTQNGTRNRGLFKFDLTNVPTNAVVISAAVMLTVTHTPDEPPTNSTFGLHRMLRPWGEGDNVATNKPGFGQGLPAGPGEVTWSHSFYPTNAWSVPGGAAEVDFSSVESSFQFVSDEATYYFPFTPELLADVQYWVNHPEANHGWILISNDEDTIFTARRFASREDPNAPPSLEIEYLVPPHFDSVNRAANNQAQLHFTAQSGQTYTVQYSPILSATNTWFTLINISAPTATTNLVVSDTTSATQRFYRLRTE